MDMPWVDLYEPRKWVLYEVPIHSDDFEQLKKSLRHVDDSEILVCCAESQMAERLWNDKQSVDKVLFFDIEQLWSMGLDKFYGATIDILTAKWKDYDVGSLVMTTYKGIKDKPPFFTIGIASQ